MSELHTSGRWTKIEEGWYEHGSGAIVQHWESRNKLAVTAGWYAWRPGDSDIAWRRFATMREARQYCVEGK